LSDPRLLVLDDPSLGLAPAIVETRSNAAASTSCGTDIAVGRAIDSRALEIADDACMLQTGRSVPEGAADALRHDPQVQRIDLGLSA